MPIRTARQAFLANPAKEPFKKLAETIAFDVACEYALLAFVEELDSANEPVGGFARYCQLDGAMRALRILRELHLEVKPPTQPKHPQLRVPS